MLVFVVNQYYEADESCLYDGLWNKCGSSRSINNILVFIRLDWFISKCLVISNVAHLSVSVEFQCLIVSLCFSFECNVQHSYTLNSVCQCINIFLSSKNLWKANGYNSLNCKDLSVDDRNGNIILTIKNNFIHCMKEDKKKHSLVFYA